MGTRGCVAVGTLKKWRGVYNHNDSYATGLGREVWQKLQEARRDAGLKAFAERLALQRTRLPAMSQSVGPAS
jgi:hypothetical protein